MLKNVALCWRSMLYLYIATCDLEKHQTKGGTCGVSAGWRGRASCRWCSYRGSVLLDWCKHHVFPISLLLHHGEPLQTYTRRPGGERLEDTHILYSHIGAVYWNIALGCAAILWAHSNVCGQSFSFWSFARTILWLCRGQCFQKKKPSPSTLRK